MNQRDKIQRAVEKLANKPVSHVESAPVVETFQGKTIWQGIVEVFRVEIHHRNLPMDGQRRHRAVPIT